MQKNSNTRYLLSLILIAVTAEANTNVPVSAPSNQTWMPHAGRVLATGTAASDVRTLEAMECCLFMAIKMALHMLILWVIMVVMTRI